MGQKLNVYSEFACLCGYLLNDCVLYSSGVTQSIELLYKDAITELQVCQNRKFHQTKVSPNGPKLNQGKAYDVTSLLLVVGIGIAKSAMVVQNIRLDGGPFFLEAVEGEKYVLAWNRCLWPIRLQQCNQQPRIEPIWLQHCRRGTASRQAVWPLLHTLSAQTT